MIPAVPYIILGLSTTIALTLYIMGCSLTNNWYLMFNIIPAFFSCFMVYILQQFLDENSYYESEGITLFTLDSTIFYLVFFLFSTIGLPTVFLDCGMIKDFCYGMDLGGDAAVFIGFILYIWASGKVNQNSF